MKKIKKAIDVSNALIPSVIPKIITKEGPAPSPVSEATRVIDLTGFLMPVDNRRQPLFLKMPGTRSLFLPTFSSENALEVFKTMPGSPFFENIVKITDGREFMSYIPLDIRIVMDLRPHDDPEKRARGMIRFAEVLER